MTTRHLYNADTVGATLLHALAHGDDMLAIQAFKELYTSEEFGLLQNLLNLAWFLSSPEHQQQKNRYEAFCAGDPLLLLTTLLGSPFSLPEQPAIHALEPPTRGSRSPPDTWQKWPAGWTAEQAGALYYAVKCAIHHGNWRRATYLTAPFMIGNMLAISALLMSLGIHRALTDTLCTTTFVPLSYRILEHAYASLTAKPATPVKRHISMVTNNTREERSMKVSPHGCTLWSVKAPPITELLGSPVCIVNNPTAFWKQVVAKYSIRAEGDRVSLSDEVCEEFYETYFPSDIPDEWSDAERAKSHGFVVPVAGTNNPWTAAFLHCWA